jgi:hypothetical protein
MFCDLLDKHKGEEAWLFTKGPSFDDFDMDTAGRLRVGVNQSCQYIKDVSYCVTFWADGLQFILPDGCRLLNGKDEMGRNVASRPHKSSDTFEPKTLPLFFQYSTMSLAMSYLAWMGVKAVHLIGCDPAQGYAKPFGAQRSLNEDETLVQKQTRNLVIDMANIAGITLYDYGRGA